jgi:hypothetical protein
MSAFREENAVCDEANDIASKILKTLVDKFKEKV